MPDAMKTEIVEIDENEWKEIKATIQEAINQLQEFRKQEGQSLAVMLQDKIQCIGGLLEQIEPFEKERIEKLRENWRIIWHHCLIKLIMTESFRAGTDIFIERFGCERRKSKASNHFKVFSGNYAG